MIETPVRPLALALGGATAMAAAMGIGRFLYTPLLPSMVEALGLTKGEAGLIASANFAGYLAGALAAAAISAVPGGARRWLLVALAASALSTGAMGLAASTPAFLALRFIGGVASAVTLVFASSLVLDRLAAAGRGGLSAAHFAGVGAGIALSAVLTAALDGVGADWRAMWFGGGAVSLLALAVTAALIPEARASAAPSAVATRASTGPGLWALAVAYGLFGFGYVITATFIVAIVRGPGAIAGAETAIWLVVGLAAMPSVAVWTLVGRRIGLTRAFALASVVEAIGVAASVAWGGVVGLGVSAVLLGGTFVGLTALGLMAARTLAAGDARRRLAAMTAAFGVGQIVGPIVAGYGHDMTGSFLVPSMLAAAGLCLGAALVLATYRA
ncbi:MAG: YbfB/YjiJ family MFS transporter [Rhodospirillales bacterium]|nr:MAG: YbfB/YjiJ family MFS transporter [Rhodospirillales bacterium]